MIHQTTLHFHRRWSAFLIASLGFSLALFFFFGTEVLAFNERTSIVTSPYSFAAYIDKGDEYQLVKTLRYGGVSVVHRVEMTSGGVDVLIGQDIVFAYNPEVPEFHSVAREWDTPYGRWCVDNVSSDCFGGDILATGHLHEPSENRQAYEQWSAIKPAVDIVSSNPSVVSCSGLDCTAVNSGTATLTAQIDETEARIWVYMNECEKCASGFFWASHPSFAYLYPFDNFDETFFDDDDPEAAYLGVNTLTLPATSVSWNVTVSVPPANCGDGTVQAGEDCDDGDESTPLPNNGSCPASCSIFCGVNVCPPSATLTPPIQTIPQGTEGVVNWEVSGPATACFFSSSPSHSPWDDQSSSWTSYQNGPGNWLRSFVRIFAPNEKGLFRYNLECLNGVISSGPLSAIVRVGNGPFCGDEVREGSEQCDLGITNGVCPSTCTASCVSVTCGQCCDGNDGDLDGLIDGADPGCWAPPGVPGPTQCGQSEQNCGNNLCEPLTGENPVLCPTDCKVIDIGEG